MKIDLLKYISKIDLLKYISSISFLRSYNNNNIDIIIEFNSISNFNFIMKYLSFGQKMVYSDKNIIISFQIYFIKNKFLNNQKIMITSHMKGVISLIRQNSLNKETSLFIIIPPCNICIDFMNSFPTECYDFNINSIKVPNLEDPLLL